MQFGINKINEFFSFFSFRESYGFASRERHGCDFVRGMGVPLSEREKTRAPGSVFRPVFFMKKIYVLLIVNQFYLEFAFS